MIQFFSESTNQLLQRAARRAVEWGSLDLTSEHLLHAALEDGVVRRVMVLDGSLESDARVVVGVGEGGLTFEVVEGAAVVGGVEGS